MICFFVLFLPLATALDCSSIDYEEICEEIMESDISNEEKGYLLSDIITESKYYPDSDFVYSWNIKQDLVKSEDISSSSSSLISDAWVEIYTVMPSVQVDDNLYISDLGNILVGYNHNVYASGSTGRWDCKTERRVVTNSGELSVYVNGELVGSSNLVEYSSYDVDSLEILAKYEVNVRVERKHYQTDKYTSKCEYSYSDYVSDSLVVEDVLYADIYKFDSTVSFEMIDEYYDTSKAKYSVSDVVSSELVLGESSYVAHKYLFSENIADSNILQIVAEPHETDIFENIFLDEEYLVFPKTEYCDILVYGFFGSENISCSLEYSDIDFDISTDKVHYTIGEDISVSISPEANYRIYYDGQEYESTGELLLNASEDTSIEVELNGVSRRYLVQTSEGQPFALFFSLGYFSLLSLAIFRVFRSYGGVLFD